jgi:hypothetical protein
MTRGQRGGPPTVVELSFLDREEKQKENYNITQFQLPFSN